MEENRKYIPAGVLNIIILAIVALFLLFIKLDVEKFHLTVPEEGSDDALGVALMLILMLVYNFLPMAIIGIFTLISGILWLKRGANGERLQMPMLIVGTVLKSIGLISCGIFFILNYASEIYAWAIFLAVVIAEMIVSIVFDFKAMKKEPVAFAIPLAESNAVMPAESESVEETASTEE